MHNQFIVPNYESNMFKQETQVKKYLLEWYSANARILPWRKKYKNNLPNPYFVFVSEYMLQQTTVNTVKNKFHDFIVKWPNFEKLAQTNEPQILKFWSGLGYYSRARNLLKSAKIINKDFNNKIPTSYDELIKLPGVGDYTAKAILGIAFNKSVMPLDSNIERILVRLHAINKPIIKVKNKLKDLGCKFKSEKFSSNLIQSFMDYGSEICVPRNPKCEVCGINKLCQSFKKNLQLKIPIKLKKTNNKPVKYTRAYVLVNEKNEILVRHRPEKGMLASMLEVPNDDWVKDKKLLTTDAAVQNLKTKLKPKGFFEYSFSHFDLETEIFYGSIKKSQLSNANWIKKSTYSRSGLPTVMKKIVKIAV